MTNSHGVVIFSAQGFAEEQQIRSFLEAHGIATSVRGEALRKTHALTLDGIGQVEILVSSEDEAEARQLLAEAERGDFALDENSVTDEPSHL